eukprot:13252910-Alexandrium_andersonii.AAC.1
MEFEEPDAADCIQAACNQVWGLQMLEHEMQAISQLESVCRRACVTSTGEVLLAEVSERLRRMGSALPDMGEFIHLIGFVVSMGGGDQDLSPFPQALRDFHERF